MGSVNHLPALLINHIIIIITIIVVVVVVVVVSTTEFWASLLPPSNALKPNYVSSFQLEKYLFCFFLIETHVSLKNVRTAESST